MSHVPSVVTVVTIKDDMGKRGVTIGSFVSLSLEPPLICFNIQKSLKIYERIISVTEFAVHVLREDQAFLSDRFANSSLDSEAQFDDIDFELTANGTPILSEHLVRFVCRPHAILPGGDHSIVVGEVLQIEERGNARPVVYHQRAYHGVGRHIADREQKSGS